VSELRQDPVTGVWTVLAPHRGGRPSDYGCTPEKPHDAAGCPFCPGHEGETPPARLALSLPGEIGWTVRAFENRYPFLEAADDDEGLGCADAPWPYVARPGFGVSEVIVETPRHTEGLADYSPEHAALVVDAYAERIRVWREDGRFAAVLLFRNYGWGSGASLAHAHTQLVATARVPDAIVRELGNFSQASTERGSCVLCEETTADTAGGRTVFDDGVCAVHVPWAAPVPYFMRIAPAVCAPTLADSTAAQRASLGACLVAAARAIRGAFGDTGFNIVVHDSPYSAQRLGLAFHWHVEIVPRTPDMAGFGWGSGMYSTTVDPDEAAATLRAGLAAFPARTG
jgi:UDPglucose--hexose-1-phosphate uridylyltransferase